MSCTPCECLVPIAQFTDELMAATRGDQPNLLVGIGYLGGMTTFLNPASAADAIARYEEITKRAVDSGDSVKILAFTDTFDTYDFSGCE